MHWELRVALRYLTARRKQDFISLISAVAVLGVAVGVAALFIALGLMTGLQSEIRARILGATAHLSIFRTRAQPAEDVQPLVDRVRRVKGVAGAAPALYGKALLASSVLAEQLNVGVGDVVTITSPRGRLSPVGMLPRMTHARVVGTVKTG